VGVARIGRVTFSKTGRTIYYHGKSLQSLNGAGFKGNFMTSKVEKGIGFLAQRKTVLMDFAGRPTPIDPDVREQYCTIIRKQPSKVRRKTT
jgi:hypothetical protein